MTQRSVRCVAKSTLPGAALSTPSLNLRSCGCARRFVPTLPQHSQSAPVLARRRSRSSTGSSSKSARSVSSGRNTPSPSSNSQPHLKHKSMSESHLADLVTAPDLPVDSVKTTQQPVYFSTSVLIRLTPNKNHYLEQVKYEMRYGPTYNEDEETQPQTLQTQQYRTELEIQVENNPVETSSNQT